MIVKAPGREHATADENSVVEEGWPSSPDELPLRAGTTSCALIRACLCASTCQARSIRFRDKDSGPFPRSVIPCFRSNQQRFARSA